MIFKYDSQNLNFDQLITELVFADVKKNISSDERNLDTIHKYFSNDEIPVLVQKIYSLFKSKKFQDKYDKLCDFIIQKFHDSDTKFQSIPSIRIHVPETKSVDFHNDIFYGYGEGVTNYWLPITKVFQSNSLQVISERASSDIVNNMKTNKLSINEFNNSCLSNSKSLEMEYGQIYKFNSKIIHGSLFNLTDKTRVSFDFRMVDSKSNTGLKDKSFFIRSRAKADEIQKDKNVRAIIYFNREGKEDKLPAQKYQQLNSLEYCRENQITPVRLETELSGFDYFPTLFHLLDYSKEENFNNIVIYSKHNLPTDPVLLKNFKKQCAIHKMTVHYVLEDVSEIFH